MINRDKTLGVLTMPKKEIDYDATKASIERKKQEIGLTDYLIKQGRPYRTKPRSPIEKEMLVRISLHNWNKGLRDGKIKRLGKKEWQYD